MVDIVVIDSGRDCSNPSFCMMQGPAEMTFGEAKQFCSDQQMELPKPKNQEENGIFTQFAPTWLDVYVNDLLRKFFLVIC